MAELNHLRHVIMIVACDAHVNVLSVWSAAETAGILGQKGMRRWTWRRWGGHFETLSFCNCLLQSRRSECSLSRALGVTDDIEIRSHWSNRGCSVCRGDRDRNV